MGYARYSEYKDSGVTWLGEIPSHWQTPPLKYYFDVQLGKMLQPKPTTDKDFEVFYLKAQHVQWNYITTDSLPIMWANTTDIQKYSVENGDLLVCEGGEVGRCFILKDLKEIAIIQNALHRVRATNQTVIEFLNYVIQHTANVNWFSILCNKATIAHLTSEKLINLYIPLPPKDEQTQIVSFLDHELSKIDLLIEKQQLLLEKLAEQRTATITQAVTKGLDPNAEMQDSGVEWLGEVPKHWQTWKITHAIDLIGSGTTPKSDNSAFYDGETLWVTTSELRESIINDTKQKITAEALANYPTLKIYPKNSVAMAMYGATIGRLGILGKEATFNQACCVFSESEILHYKFLYYWLWQRRPILISLSNGGGQPNLNQDDLKKLKIPLPPLNEQIKIVEYIHHETQKIDQMTDTVNRTITRLTEYRSTLITQAVTGKIKVF